MWDLIKADWADLVRVSKQTIESVTTKTDGIKNVVKEAAAKIVDVVSGQVTPKPRCNNCKCGHKQ